MWTISLAGKSHEMSRYVFLEKWTKIIRMSSAANFAWWFKGYGGVVDDNYWDNFF